MCIACCSISILNIHSTFQCKACTVNLNCAMHTQLICIDYYDEEYHKCFVRKPVFKALTNNLFSQWLLHIKAILQLNLAILIILISNFMIVFQAPESEPSQLPVTHYKLSCTPSEGDSCSETLPADMTSFSDLPVVAGNLYTITVSALSNDRESQNNPHLNIGRHDS